MQNIDKLQSIIVPLLYLLFIGVLSESYLSNSGLTVDVRDPHLPLLVEPPVEGHRALRQLLVGVCVEEALQGGDRFRLEIYF